GRRLHGLPPAGRHPRPGEPGGGLRPAQAVQGAGVDRRRVDPPPRHPFPGRGPRPHPRIHPGGGTGVLLSVWPDPWERWAFWTASRRRPQYLRGLAGRPVRDETPGAMTTNDTRADRPLEGRVAVVTGALGLLGREHCRALADAGARVVLTDIDGAACARVAAEFGRGALGLGADITSEPSVKALRDQVLATAGRLDVLVN